jgi:threonine/homoserine/homoserine lactone efflux protein
MISYFFAGAVAGLAVAMPIGAVGSYLVGLAARERTAAALAAALGIASVDGAYAILAGIGGTGLQAMLSEVSGWLTYAAAITLVLVAVHTMRTAFRRYRGDIPTRSQLRN